MKNLMPIILSLTLFACDQLDMKDKQSDTQETPVVRARTNELEEKIKVNVTGADPEKYTVQFSWPLFEAGKIFRIRLGNVLTEVQPNQTFFTHTVSHNQTLNYSFDVLDSNRRPLMTFHKAVIIPYDFVVKSDNSTFSQATRIEANRIYLSEDTPLTVNGQNVDLIANEIHAEKGFIETYPEKVKAKVIRQGAETDELVWPFAPDLTDGASGGNLTINSRKLFGRLKIYMRGQKGGKGPKGDPKVGRASTGVPAGTGPTECYNECTKFSCLVQPDPSIQLSRVCGCKSDGPPGGKGNKGDRGNPGKPGMDGGPTGNVRVVVQEYVPLEGIDPSLPTEGGAVVQVIQQPGPGGIGGTGGDGQLGGYGGPETKKICSGKQGPEGDAGDPGPDGDEGKPGALGMKCVYVGTENINECSQ